MREEQEMVEKTMEASKEKIVKVQGSKKGTTQRDQEGKEGDVDPMGRGRQVSMGYSKGGKEPIQPKRSVLGGVGLRGETPPKPRRRRGRLYRPQYHNHRGRSGKGDRKRY